MTRKVDADVENRLDYRLLGDGASVAAERESALSGGGALRSLLTDTGTVAIPECYSALTARIAQTAGFGAVYLGGAGVGSMHLAIPDHGLISIAEMAQAASSIIEATSMPLIIDADQGGETSVNVRRTMKILEHVGVAGLHIEDTRNPKHLYRDDHLMSIREMCARVEAAVRARSNDTVIIARTDEMFNRGSVEEAIRRGIAYAEAGADVFMCPRMDIAMIEAIGSAVPIPLLDLNHPLANVQGTRLKVSLFTGTAVRAALASYKRLMRGLRDTGTYPPDVEAMPRDEQALLMRDDEYLKEADRWRERERS